MRDGIDAVSPQSAIAYAQSHPSVKIVCGYCDGAFVWPQSAIDQVRGMGLIYVPISSVGTDNGWVLDVEPGNLNAVQSVNWTIGRRAAGIANPVIYVAQWAAGYTWAEVLAAHAARGVAAPSIWAAPWPSAVVPSGSIGAQYSYPGNVDLDVFADSIPGWDTAAAEKPRAYVVEV